jgi:hypothetical protein
MNDARCKLTAEQLARIHDRVLKGLSWADEVMKCARQYDPELSNLSLGGAASRAWGLVRNNPKYDSLIEAAQRASPYFDRTIARIGKVSAINWHEAVAWLVYEIWCALGSYRDPWVNPNALVQLDPELEPWEAGWPTTRVELLKLDFDWYEARAAVDREYLDAVERLPKPRERVVVRTAGDLWKALTEGMQPACECSEIAIRAGANVPTKRCPDAGDEAKRVALDRAIALVRAEGGEKAAAMEKLIGQVQKKTGKDDAAVANMPLGDFVAVLWPSEPQQSEPAKPAPRSMPERRGPCTTEYTASQLAASIASLIRDHFQVEGQPAPPNPGSWPGEIEITSAINALADLVGPGPAKLEYQCDELEIQRVDSRSVGRAVAYIADVADLRRHEVEIRLREVLATIADWKSTQPTPPFPADALRKLEWASERLGEYDAEDVGRAAAEPVGDATRAPESDRGKGMPANLPEWASLPELLDRLELRHNEGAIGKRVERWRKTHDDDYREVQNRRRNEARYQYRVAAIMPLLNDLRLTARRSNVGRNSFHAAILR